jgi:uncharacterized membrane protein
MAMAGKPYRVTRRSAASGAHGETNPAKAATLPPRKLGGLENDRLNFLTDGVYAIALTLLVLELKVPEHLRPEQLLPALIANGPKFAAYVIGFSAVAIGWTFNFLIHPLVRRGGPMHLACTLISLLAASLIPFSASVLGNYPDSPWGIVIYAADVGLLAGVFAIDLLHAERTVISAHIDRAPIHLLAGTAIGVAVIGALCGGILAFVSPRLCLWIIGAVTATIWVEYFVLVNWFGRALGQSPDEAIPIGGDVANRRER